MNNRKAFQQIEVLQLRSPNAFVGRAYSRKRINDEFTHLKVSRQRKWQLRCARNGRCIKCGAPLGG